MSCIDQIELELTIVIGAVEMPLGDVVRLHRGAVIPLRRSADEPLTVEANGSPIAKGAVKLDGEKVLIEVIAGEGDALTSVAKAG